MIKKIKIQIVRFIFFIRAYVYKLTFKKVSFGKNITFYGKPIITMVPNSDIHIGNNVVLCSNAKDTELGTKNSVILRTLSQNASLTIGDDTSISGAVICAATSVTIGKGCLLGSNVTIMDTDFHPINSLNRRYDKENILTSRIDIKDNVVIGYNAIILKGVMIGKNSVVAAGSVIVNDIPENVIVAGNPAKIIKKLFNS